MKHPLLLSLISLSMSSANGNYDAIDEFTRAKDAIGGILEVIME